MDDQLNQNPVQPGTDPIGAAPTGDLTGQPAVSEPTPPSATPAPVESGNDNDVMAALKRIEDKLTVIATKLGA